MFNRARYQKRYYERWRKTVSSDDSIFREMSTSEIVGRDSYYSLLLELFYTVTKARMILKEIFKWIFFLIMMGAMVVIGYLTVMVFRKYLDNADFETLSNALPLLITSIVGFISTIIAIPVVITKYLFNTSEDDNITAIIVHTQEHDALGRQWAMDIADKIKSKKPEFSADKRLMQYFTKINDLESLNKAIYKNYFIDSISKEKIVVNKNKDKETGEETLEYEDADEISEDLEKEKPADQKTSKTS